MSEHVDVRAQIRDFLTTRRARVTPEQAGLRTYGERRRVSGLRRSEVAQLAGISVEYYTRLERGNARGASEEVLEAIARALRLDEVERGHLMTLARSASPARRPGRRAAQRGIGPGLQVVLDAMTEAAAFVRNGRLDLLSANQLGYALYNEAFDDPVRPPNLARFVFLDPRSREFYRDWEGIAADAVGSLRAEAGRDPSDPALCRLVGELSTRSEDFRVRWAAHDVKHYRSGVQPFRHPVVGELSLVYEALGVVGDPELVIVAYTAERGSPSHDGLRLLGSWATTLQGADQPETAHPGDER